MTVTFANVLAWNVGSLRIASDNLLDICRTIDRQRANLDAEQNVLAESWTGDAAVAAAERVASECRTLSSLAAAIESLAREFSDAADVAGSVRARLTSVLDSLTERGFEVDANGLVTADRAIASLQRIAGPLGEDAVLALQIRTHEATVSVLTAVRHANDVAIDVCNRVRERTRNLDECALAAAGGRLEPDGAGGFSWRPDLQAVGAGVTIGAVADTTGHLLQTSAAASADDVAMGIGRRLGPAGALLGTIPAISNDIEGGMHPTKAVVTESAGAVAGVVVGGALGQVASGAVAGSAIGSVVPGAGTAVGLVVGVAVGGVLAYGVPKVGQWIWE